MPTTLMGLQNYLQNLVHQFSDALQIQLKDSSYVMVMWYVIRGKNVGSTKQNIPELKSNKVIN